MNSNAVIFNVSVGGYVPVTTSAPIFNQTFEFLPQRTFGGQAIPFVPSEIALLPPAGLRNDEPPVEVKEPAEKVRRAISLKGVPKC